MTVFSGKFFSLAIAIVLFFSFFTPPAWAGLSPEEVAAQQAKLEQDLQNVEQQIAAQTKLLQAKQQESASIERDISILTYQISTAKLNIQVKQLQIKGLGEDIGKKEGTITTLSARLDRSRLALAELLRQIKDLDDTSLLEVVLSENDFSQLFADVNSFASIEQAMHSSLNQITTTKNNTEQEKARLQARRDAELDAQKVIETEKKTIEIKEAQKQNLLKISKNQELGYKTVLANREQERTKIKNALFRLRGSTAISFGEAYNYAVAISAKTGVRPAFLLAIITQESNLGENVGTCNQPGDSPARQWQQIMKPSRDQAPFLTLMKALGLDPATVPLSCPMAGGWGGAMGPAQFIPSTWALYADRIAEVVGTNPANPWLPKHAFTASALLLRDLGASAGGFTAERQAALRYYAGAAWNKAKNAFYGDEVMNIAAGYQQQINVLQNT